jgi:catabolite regulation protein CreA
MLSLPIKCCVLLSVVLLSYSWKFSLNKLRIPALESHVDERSLRRAIAIALTSISLLSSQLTLSPANALSIKQVGDISTSGFIFKDSLKLMSFKDPKIPGVSVYLSDFDRPITEKLSSNFFDDPSSTSITCVANGPVIVNKQVDGSQAGEEIFEESRNLFFKVRESMHLILNPASPLIDITLPGSSKSISDACWTRTRERLSMFPTRRDLTNKMIRINLDLRHLYVLCVLIAFHRTIIIRLLIIMKIYACICSLNTSIVPWNDRQGTKYSGTSSRRSRIHQM